MEPTHTGGLILEGAKPEAESCKDSWFPVKDSRAWADGGLHQAEQIPSLFIVVTYYTFGA